MNNKFEVTNKIFTSKKILFNKKCFILLIVLLVKVLSCYNHMLKSYEFKNIFGSIKLVEKNKIIVEELRKLLDIKKGEICLTYILCTF